MLKMKNAPRAQDPRPTEEKDVPMDRDLSLTEIRDLSLIRVREDPRVRAIRVTDTVRVPQRIPLLSVARI